MSYAEIKDKLLENEESVREDISKKQSDFTTTYNIFLENLGHSGFHITENEIMTSETQYSSGLRGVGYNVEMATGFETSITLKFCYDSKFMEKINKEAREKIIHEIKERRT